MMLSKSLVALALLLPLSALGLHVDSSKAAWRRNPSTSFGNDYGSYGNSNSLSYNNGYNNGYNNNNYNSYGQGQYGNGYGMNQYSNQNYGPYQGGYRSGYNSNNNYYGGGGGYDDYYGGGNGGMYDNYISTPFTERGYRSRRSNFNNGWNGVNDWNRYGGNGMNNMYGGGYNDYNNNMGGRYGGGGYNDNMYGGNYNSYNNYNNNVGGRVLRPDIGGNTYKSGNHNNSIRRRFDSDWDDRWGTSQSSHAHTVMGPGANRYSNRGGGSRFHTDQWNGISGHRYNDYYGGQGQGGGRNGNRIFSADMTGPRTYAMNGGGGGYDNQGPYNRGSTAYQRGNGNYGFRGGSFFPGNGGW